MSNRNYATDYVVHAHGPGACQNPRRRDRVASEVRADVTCKRCLASLAKRDRAFQRKARGWWTYPWRAPREQLARHGGYFLGRNRAYAWNPCYGLALDAARAIAAEEGRLGGNLALGQSLR